MSNRGRMTFLYIVAVCLLVIMLLVYVWQYIRMVEIQMSIKDIDLEMRSISERLEVLGFDKARLSRLERIDFAAQERLGMRAPGKDDIVYLARASGLSSSAVPVSEVTSGPPPGPSSSGRVSR